MTSAKTSTSLLHAESFPINKPPFFTGSDYQFWKNKMTWYLESLDLEVWKTILFGYTFPTKDVDGGKEEKPLTNITKKKVENFN